MPDFEKSSDDDNRFLSSNNNNNNNIVILNKESESNNYQVIKDPVQAVSDLLSELILNCDVVEIDQELLSKLAESSKVQLILERTCILNYVNIDLLISYHETICFAINLANLLWIHGSIHFGSKSNLYDKSWSVRQIQNGLIGYNVGQLGFVSLYDLHSILLNYPNEIKSERLKSLPLANNARTIFALSLPEVCTPRITVLNVDNLEHDLEKMHKEYLNAYLTIYDGTNLLIPSTILWYIENRLLVSHKNNDMREDTKQSKLNLLIESANGCELSASEITYRDVFLLTEIKCCIKFTYTGFEKEEIQSYNRILWNACTVHTYVLSECLQYHVMMLKSLLYITSEVHSSFRFCACNIYSSDSRCINYLLLVLNGFLNVARTKLSEVPTESNSTKQCLYSLLSLLMDNTATTDNEKDTDKVMEVDLEAYYPLFDVIDSHFVVIPTGILCQKINICRKISFEADKLHHKWPSWYDIFTYDVNDVLINLVEYDYCEFSEKWFTIHFEFDSSFKFSIEACAAYISLLAKFNYTNGMKNAIRFLGIQDMINIVDYLIKYSCCPVVNLIYLVTTLLGYHLLSQTQKLKLQVLLIGLRMISFIPLLEQPLYMNIVYSPILIIEQLLLAGRITVLQTVIKETSDYIGKLPESVQESESISKSQIDEVLRIYAGKALLLVNVRPNSPIEHVADNASVIMTDLFVPPNKPPEMKHWVPNDEVERCMCCKETVFTMFSRRHHCRRCGRLVCHSCSCNRYMVESYKKPVRICDDCFRFESSDKDSQSDVSSCSSLTTNGNEEIKWRLSLNEDHNNYVRQQFLYENAPNVSICLSILDMHSKHITIPRFLFGRCESLARILRLHTAEETNFDCVQISSIIKSLLLAAKVYYTSLNVPSGIQQCEDLFNEVNLINRLSQMNVSFPEPRSSITGITELRRVRNCLIEQNQWNLALEISTKSGLECSVIWFAWGKSCLKAGKWTEAREKFSHSSLDRNPMLLSEILQILNEEDGAETNAVESSSTPPTKISIVSKKPQQECIYYLRTYGTTTQLLEHYMKHNQLRTALEFIVQNNVSPKLFLEEVYIQSLKKGSTDNLHQLMQEMDKSLVTWKEYIRVVCACCERNNYLKVLYSIQLWLKDYVRAAMTSIRFYLHGAHSYFELMSNIEHLHNACRHLETALTQTKKNDLIMTLSLSEIEKHLNTICLQIDVSNTIMSDRECVSMHFSRVPTLLGDTSEKIDVISLIFRSTMDSKSAFAMAQRLVTEYSLNSALVYSKVSKQLIKSDREEDVIVLLKCITERISNSDSVKDEVINNTLKEVKPTKVTETMIAYVTDHVTKISLYTECGLLKSAYLLAVKYNELDAIKKIAEEADKLKMFSVKRICEQKLNKLK